MSEDVTKPENLGTPENQPQSSPGADGSDTTKKETFIQAVKFTLLSLSAGLIEAASFALLTLLIPAANMYWFTHGLSVTLSVIWNFTLNRRYTFKSAGNIPRAMALVAGFYVVFIPATMYGGQAITSALVDGGMAAAAAETIVKVATMLLNFVLEFVWWKFVVFRGTENTNSVAQKQAAKKAGSAEGRD